MEKEFNINVVVADFLDAKSTEFLNIVLNTSRTFSEKINLAWKSSFKGYINKIAERYSKARSFFYRSEPEDLYKFYVPTGLIGRSRSINRADASIFAKTPHLVIKGSGGSGKSVLARHLLLDTLRRKSKIPVFIELRCLNQSNKILVDLITKGLCECGLDIGGEVVLKGIERGKFALIFDGFDELDDDQRTQTAEDIRRLAKIGPSTWILVTSRPDELFSSWSEFSIMGVMPLKIKQAIELVEKSPIDGDLRDRFIDALQAELFKKHESFLSNPLLLSIMLLTYQDSADIPRKLSVFYSQAFEALFHRHDAWKGGYKRQRECDLDIHDFARLFAGFSLISYEKRLFSFTNIDAFSFIKKACELTNLSVPPENYINDCTQAVCLLVQDGLQIAYSHRSFQEYFTARFIADSPPVLKEQLLNRYSKYVNRDNVIQLLYEIQPEFVEIHFILPILDALFESLDIKRSKITKKSFVKYLNLVFSSMRVERNGEILASHLGSLDSPSQIYFKTLMFSIENCAESVNRSISIEEYSSAKFCAEFCGEEDVVELELRELRSTHPLINYLFEEGAYIGPDVLSIAWDIASLIRRKAADAAMPLDDIFAL